MKIAICMSGHMRTFRECYTSLKKHFLDKYDCDIYISTWKKLGYFDKVVRGLYNAFDAPIVNNEITPQLLHEVYGDNLKGLEIEDSTRDVFKTLFDPKPYPKTAGCVKIHTGHTISMMYKIYRADRLRHWTAQKASYDWIVRTRPDLKYRSGIQDVIASENISQNVVYLPTFGNWDGCNDQFAVGRTKPMEAWCKLYSVFPNYYKIGCPMNGEVLFKFHAKQCGISLERSEVKYVIKRATGEEVGQP